MPSLPVLLGSDPVFPDPRLAPRRGPRAGLVAVGGDFRPERLVSAYRSGIFPWTVDPITWWSPDPRGVLDLGGLHVSRSLRRTLRLGRFEVTRNRAFREVIVGCATAPRRGSWITPEFVEAYTELHRRGVAHSVECWFEGRLAGGVYGVAVGGLFAGESMFHRESDASKVALVHLHEHLVARGFRLFDLQMCTEITEAMGAVEIPRDEYLRRLEGALRVDCVFG